MKSIICLMLLTRLLTVFGDRDTSDRFICKDLITADVPECIITNEREGKPLVFGGIIYDHEIELPDTSGHFGHDRRVGCFFVTSIVFKNCFLNFIPTKIFESCYDIEKLDFSNSGLTFISSYVFEGKSESLEKLILNNNLIRDISSYTFDSLESLVYLNISNNFLNHINQFSFHGLISLVALDLSNNEIKTIEKSSFSQLTNLKLLNLANNKILEFKTDVSFIRYMYLNNNNLKDFRCQEISSVNSSNSESLSILHLSGNDISEVFQSNLCYYKKIFLNNNNVKSLILNENVIILEANNNNISHIELSENMEEIRLSKNNITDLTAFSQLIHLRILDLSFNKIGKLNPDSLSQLQNLKELFLENTGIHSIDFYTFSNQQNLNVLDISYNNLGNFDFNNLFALSDLNELFIDGNDLKELDFKAISENLSNLKIIGLSNNNWNCSYLVKIIQYMNSKKIKVHVDRQVYITNSSSLKGISCIKDDNKIIKSVNWETVKTLPSHTQSENVSYENENTDNFKKQLDLFKENNLKLENNILLLKKDFENQKLEMEKQINEQKQKLLDVKTELELKKLKNISLSTTNDTSDEFAKSFAKIANISNEKLQMLFFKMDHLEKEIRENAKVEPNTVKFDFLKNSQSNDSSLNSKMNSLNVLLVFTFLLALSLVIFKIVTFINKRKLLTKRFSLGSSTPINEHSI